MNTAPESIYQLERQSYDYGYACGLAKHGELCAIIEDMAGMFNALSRLSDDYGQNIPSVKKAEDAYRKYLAITTKSA